MNWLERARREFCKSPEDRAANAAERNLTAAMAAHDRASFAKTAPARICETPARRTANTDDRNLTAVTAVLPEAPEASNGSNGSTPFWQSLEYWLREAFEERAAIMEFDGGLSRGDAERAALALVLKRRRLH